MKRIVSLLTVMLLITSSPSWCEDSVVDTLEKAGKKILNPAGQAQKIFPTVIEERQARLDDLVKEKEQLEAGTKQFHDTTTAHLEEIKGQLDLVNDALKREPEDEFYNKKLILLNEHYQVIKGVGQTREQLLSVIDQHIALLQEYLKDPSLKEYAKDLKLAKDAYTFEDLHSLNEQIVAKEKSITQLLEQEKNAETESENRKRTAVATADAYKKKKEEQEKINVTEGLQTPFELGAGQKIELLRLEEHLFNDKKERDALQLKQIEQKRAFLKTKIFFEKLHLNVLKELLSKVKPAIKVTEADIAYAKDELAKKQQTSIAKREAWAQEADRLVKELKSKDKELQELGGRYGIALGTDLDDWTRHPVETVAGFTRYLELADRNDTILLLKRRKEHLDAQIALEEETMRFEEVRFEVRSTFYKATEQAFISEEETRHELKKYEVRRAELKAMLALYKERRSADQDTLNRQKNALVALKNVRKKLQEKKNTIFKSAGQDYATCLELLNSAEDKISSQIDLLGKTHGIYSDVIHELNKAIKHIDFIISELELTTIWQRSKFAITWTGMQQVIPNLETFVADLRSYLTTFNISAALEMLQDALSMPFVILCLALYLVAIVVCKFALPPAKRAMVHFSARYRALHSICLILAAVLDFVSRYIVSIGFWVMLWAILVLYPVTDSYIYIIFYLLSIPYLSYLANRLIAHFVRFNSGHNYVFIDRDFAYRFIIILSVFLYATISIFLFREAFILAAYYKSELPTILLAINFIIFQISLIFLIAKEQILSVIPERHGFWEWVRNQVDRFYYLILMVAIAVIVMSNPYVGFGKLVLYILLNVVYTLLLIRVLVWVHTLVKRGLSHVFFSVSQDGIRERFAYGKTLYGFFVLTIFLIVLFVGTIVAAKIWGWPESITKITRWSDIMTWIQTPIILEKTANPISLYSIAEILLFIMAGFVVASAINLFILDKIFDVLLADPGVQNTVSSIVRYVIIITSLILGFQAVGLGDLIWWLILTLGVGIGWVIKDPVGDFIAYFIILVQRPLKIGDYIQIDEDTKGVVRKITPRSVVVRRHNSVTIVLPNMSVITKPIFNWNYARGFIAFDDILITVSYKEDPAKVKELLLKVLDENTFILKSPNPVVRLKEFGEDGFVFMARGFLSSNYTLDQWDIASDVRLAIMKTFKQHHIRLAIPTRLVVSKELVAQQAHVIADMVEEERKKG